MRCEASVLKQSLYLPFRILWFLSFLSFLFLFFPFFFKFEAYFAPQQLLLGLLRRLCCAPTGDSDRVLSASMCSAQAVDGFSHLSNHAVCREQGDCKAPLVKHWAPYVSRLFFLKLYWLSDSINPPFLYCSNNWEVVFLVCLFCFCLEEVYCHAGAAMEIV